MKRLRRVFRRVCEWAERRFFRPYRTMEVQDSLPAELMRHTVYIVREDGFDEQVALLCRAGSANEPTARRTALLACDAECGWSRDVASTGLAHEGLRLPFLAAEWPNPLV